MKSFKGIIEASETVPAVTMNGTQKQITRITILLDEPLAISQLLALASKEATIQVPESWRDKPSQL